MAFGSGEGPVPWYEFWGSDQHVPALCGGWSWAMDTPFQWTKQVASHYGGTSRAWPSRGPDTSMT